MYHTQNMLMIYNTTRSNIFSIKTDKLFYEGIIMILVEAWDCDILLKQQHSYTKEM
jgi:hypothetical protein